MEWNSKASPSAEREGSRFPPPSFKKQRISISQRLGFFHLRSLGDGPKLSHKLICLKSNQVYTVGRSRRHCEIVLEGRCISRLHCQIFLDGSDRKLRLIDGFFPSPISDLGEISRSRRSGCEGLGTRGSLNGVFVNGCTLQKGIIAELSGGDEIFFGCGIGSDRSCRIRHGFVVERIVFSEAAESSDAGEVFVLKSNSVSKGSSLCRLGDEQLPTRAALLLNQCRRILQSADPVSYLRCSLDLDTKEHLNTGAEKANDALEVIGTRNSDQNVVGNEEYRNCSMYPEENVGQSNSHSHSGKDPGISCYSDGKTFFLNRLEYMGTGTPGQHTGVTLPELLHPVESLVRVFIATFTCDVSWFLSCCQVPNHLPVTVACHNAERCWSARHDSRTLAPYSNYPNLLLVFPPFPDVIAFGKDPKKQGVACHHPKLIVLQREESIRVVVTSANLNLKQWNHVTNTVWWQDFPVRNTPDYSALFATIEDSKSDFAAQLTGFMATLITDVPSQAHWITELTKYDFRGAVGHLVASVPGMHAQNSRYSGSDHCSSVKQIMYSQSSDMKYLGSVQASVVGLSHRFHTATDSNGAQMKTLASILGKCRENMTGILEVLLKRNTKIPADANAVSVLVTDLDESSEGDCIQLGFLPRDVAKWVSPLSDVGFFNFSAFIYPKEALAAAFGETNMKVQLLLYVTQGTKFPEIARLIQPEHIAPLCTLLASMQRSVGLWRLQEVLSRYKWPELLETEFLYGSSSIGTSINAQFLASFSAAAGKRSCQFSESEESDPEWGCWTTVHELKNPSIRILFPTIERVKNGACGIQSSRRLLSFSEKTWQRLRSAGIFHDAIPHPGDRVGYPMHVKIARRRFQSKTGQSSFGWIYCGSHNFSPAAWGHTKFPSSSESNPRRLLHICNYELGIVLVVPPPELDIPRGQASAAAADGKMLLDLDDIVLPFVMPAPKYKGSDRPATAQAMREAAAIAALQRDISLAAATAATEEVDEDIPGEEEEEEKEEEMMEASSDYLAEEKEEEKVYAEMLWSQVDSSEG